MHEAQEINFSSPVSISSFTPNTIVVNPSDLAGAEMITFFAPWSRCGCTFSAVRKTPVHSNTMSIPRSFHGSSVISLVEKL